MDTTELQRKLNLGSIGTSILLGNIKLLDEGSIQTAAFRDSRYFPFYYHLGSQVNPKSVCQIGPKLGLPAACFLQKCKTVETWEVLNEDNLPWNMVSSNIRKFFKGEVSLCYAENELKKCDLALLTEEYKREEHTSHLKFLWDGLESEGLLVVDYITINEEVKGSFFDFCRVKNLEPITFDTRYGVGIIKKR